jgi:hypothetical protein
VFTTLREKHGDDWQTTKFKLIEPEYISLMTEAYRILSGRPIWVAINSTIFASSSSIFVIPLPGVVKKQLSRPREGHALKHDLQRAEWADNDRKVYLSTAKRMGCLVLTSFDNLETAYVL